MSNCRLKKIQPVPGEIFTLRVPSISEPEFPRLVDISFYNFNGGCDCPRFKFNCEPMLSRGANKAEHLRCGHIKDARSYFLDEIIPTLAESLRGIAKAKSVPLVLQAEAIVTAIQNADPASYQVVKKLGDLLEIKEHVAQTIDQLAA